jgi:hypothetical protein
VHHRCGNGFELHIKRSEVGGNLGVDEHAGRGDFHEDFGVGQLGQDCPRQPAGLADAVPRQIARQQHPSDATDAGTAKPNIGIAFQALRSTPTASLLTSDRAQEQEERNPIAAGRGQRRAERRQG